MTPQFRWPSLSYALRDAIESDIGRVTKTVSLPWTRSAPYAAVLRTRTHRPVVLKAAPECHKAAEYVRREAIVSPRVAHVAPAFVGAYNAGGWVATLAAFHDARFADLTPGSADLPRVARVLGAVSRPYAGPSLPRLCDRWPDAALSAEDRSSLGGFTLLHTNLHRTNLLVYKETWGPRVHIVGWGRAVLGPRWAELAMFYRELRRADHTAHAAHAWLAQFPTWRKALPGRLTVLARAMQRDASPRDRAVWAELIS
ncbi:phosphotransferase [Embleya sp. NPDC127516]|uniref:phosphotransferase n=1 Tax=Embleya sp. NPDC127516 TaxID=3363990 RepID=UPI0037FB31B9